MIKEEHEFMLDCCLFKGHGRAIEPDYPSVTRLKLEKQFQGQLPDSVILKKETEETAKEYYEDGTSLFNKEIQVYKQLHKLQGKHIPKFFGTANLNGSRALVLSDMGGINLEDEKMYAIDKGKLAESLKFPLEEIRFAGVELEDPSTKNILYCNGHFKVVDFEHAEIKTGKVSTDEMNKDVENWVKKIVDRYTSRQKSIIEAREWEDIS